MTPLPKFTRFLPLVPIALSFAPSALAGDGCGADGQILDRADLLARLGANAVIEDFETFFVIDSEAAVLGIPCMDDATTVLGQGPGLVQPGASYCCTSSDGFLQWNGNQYYSRTTKTVLASTPGIIIQYTQPVTAMGFDLSAFIGFGYTGTATIFDTANAVVGSVDFALVSGGPERFFVGWAHAGGIGSVAIFDVEHQFSPKFDDHAYGECEGTPPTQAFCFGDGTSTACPCGNNGSPGNGCANSDHPGGANLSTSGNPSLSADTLVLTASDVHAGFLHIFIQSNAVAVPGLWLGDGIRCIAGTTNRLFRVKGSHSTTVSAPSAGSLPPSPQTISGQSAAQGNPHSPGDIRIYQVYYRDPNPNFCPAPPGSTFNITNAMRVTWAP